MVKIIFFYWLANVFFIILPNCNPLNIIFRIILISSLLFLLFSIKGGRAIGFLWVLVYMGGMLIVFLYLIFLSLKEEDENKIREESFPILQSFLSFFFLRISLVFFISKSETWVNLNTSFENQEFYRIILTTSPLPFFSLLLRVIGVSLFLFLGILRKGSLQSKVSLFSLPLLEN